MLMREKCRLKGSYENIAPHQIVGIAQPAALSAVTNLDYYYYAHPHMVDEWSNVCVRLFPANGTTQEVVGRIQ